ncbi:MAG: hypothetical protein K2Y14_01740 [Burkholderiales bacterium]|nr:hypothetical protein [Burkholderiales bacterium]
MLAELSGCNTGSTAANSGTCHINAPLVSAEVGTQLINAWGANVFYILATMVLAVTPIRMSRQRIFLVRRIFLTRLNEHFCLLYYLIISVKLTF